MASRRFWTGSNSCECLLITPRAPSREPFTRIYIELASAQGAGWGSDAPIRVNKERTRMDHQILILTFGKPAQSYLAGLPGR
jgi:hypothetical protein